MGLKEEGKLNDKFSVPFNWHANEDEYWDTFKDRLPYIHDFFMGMPMIQQHILSDCDKHSVYRFVDKYQDKARMVMTLNARYYGWMPKSEIDELLYERIIPYLGNHNIEGVVISDYYIAKILKMQLPELTLYTSCNVTDMFSPGAWQKWRHILGVEYLNLPREAARMPSMLKQAKELGFKTKILLNEVCTMFCEGREKHTVANALFIHGNKTHIENIEGTVNDEEILNALRSCVIMPRWLKYINDDVDVYKLFGKTYPLSYLSSTLDRFLNEDDDCTLGDIVRFGCPAFHNDMTDIHSIPVKEFPDKLRSCEMAHCDTCGLCERKAAELNDKIVKKYASQVFHRFSFGGCEEE